MGDVKFVHIVNALKRQFPNEYERKLAFVSALDKYRTEHKTRPSRLSFWKRQEFIDGVPLWEYVFAHRYNGRIKIDAIERAHDSMMYEFKAGRNSTRNKNIKRAYKNFEKLSIEALQSARLDPRLAPLEIKKRPSWINVPAHVVAILSRAGNVSFSKPVVVAALTAATAAAVPDLVPYMNEVSPLVRDRMVFMGSTVAPALAFVWNVWRTKMSLAQKHRIQKLKEKHARLEAMRSERATKNRNVHLNRNIMDLEKEIQDELNTAFRKAYTQAVNSPGNLQK